MLARVNERIRELRGSRTQDEVALALGFHSKQAYGPYEKNRAPKPALIERMTKLYACSVDYILGLTNDRLGTVPHNLDPDYLAVIQQAQAAGVKPDQLRAAIAFLKQQQGG